jgi:hypothetical protein
VAASLSLALSRHCSSASIGVVRTDGDFMHITTVLGRRNGRQKSTDTYSSMHVHTHKGVNIYKKTDIHSDAPQEGRLDAYMHDTGIYTYSGLVKQCLRSAADPHTGAKAWDVSVWVDAFERALFMVLERNSNSGMLQHVVVAGG